MKGILFTTFFLLFLGQKTFSQESHSYKGIFSIGSYQGNANYSYDLIEGDTILQGPFQFSSSNLKALLKKSDSSFVITGNFTNNRPNGFWKFQSGVFSSDSTARVVDLQYQLAVGGIQNEAYGILNMGKPDGVWEFNTSRIQNSEVTQVLFKSTISFANGIPQKSFQIQNADNTLIGRFLRNGLAHDIWSLYAIENIDAPESWVFSEGYLKQIEFTSNGQDNSIDIYSNIPNKAITIPMDSQYFQILEIKASQKMAEGFDNHKMKILLEENTTKYEQINAILKSLRPSKFYPEFKVRVGHYPLDSIEKQKLSVLKTAVSESNIIANDFLNNTQLNILKLSDGRAAYLYKAVKIISEEFQEPLDNLIVYESNGILPLVTRKELISNLWPKGLPNKDLIVDNISNETYTAPKAEQFNFTINTLTGIEQVAQYANHSLKTIAQELNIKLAKNKRQQEYVTIEEKLIQQRNVLHDKVEKNQDSIPRGYVLALDNIKEFADLRLATYSDMEESDAKLSLGKKLTDCFDKINGLADEIIAQPKRDSTIMEDYQDAIWNPFMATIMNEAIKKRIAGAYRKILIPFYMEQTTKALQCENAAALTQAFDLTYKRVLELRDADTKKLERKLKRVKDPNEVMQLFNLKPLVKN